ncbi:MAG: FliM/FliN family flagellar motor switch protein [bacterium]
MQGEEFIEAKIQPESYHLDVAIPEKKDTRTIPFTRHDDGILTLLAELPAGTVRLRIARSGGALAAAFGAGENQPPVALNHPVSLHPGGGQLSLGLEHPGIYHFGLDLSGDPESPSLRIAPVLAKPSQSDLPSTAELTMDNFLEMQVPVTMELGRNRISIAKALALGQGSIIELDTLVGDELKIYAGGNLFARGEVVVVNEKFGIKITAFQQATE